MARYEDFPIERKGRQGGAYLFDAASVVDFIQAKKDEEAAAHRARHDLFEQLRLPLPSAPEGADLSPAQRLAIAKAIMLEQELALRAASLLRADEVQDALARFLREMGAFLDSLPASVCRAMNLPESVARQMRKLIDEAKRSSVQRLEAQFTAPAASLAGDGDGRDEG